MSREDARAAALRKLGNATRVRETVYEDHSIPVLDPLWRDLRYAVRQLRRTPAFTGAALLSLALGIGANTAIFQLLNALSLRSLPVAAPSELVEVRPIGEGQVGRQTGRNRQMSKPQWEQVQRRQQAFSSMLAFGDTRFNLSPRGEVRYVEGLWVSGSYFETLGVRPIAGRLFTPADDRTGCGFDAAVVSHAFWQRELGGRADAIGQVLDIGSHRVPIIGVTPPGFFGLEVGRSFDVALPLCAAGFESGQHWWLAVIGRLAPGWTREQAQSHVQGLMPAIQRETLAPTHPPAYAERYLSMSAELREARAGLSPLRRSFQQPLWVLLAIAALVLVIAAMNLANLMLARANARAQEFAIRLAIGGSRRRILQQVLTESLLLAALGAAAALVVAWFSSESIVALLSTSTDRIFLDLTVDWRVFGFTAASAAIAATVFGLAPALGAVKSRTLHTGQRGTTATRESLTLRRGLVALQVAVTLVLLFSALLFLRSFRNLSTADTGLRADDLLIANLFFQEADYPPARRRPAYRDIEDRLRALPGVTGVASASSPPLSGAFWDTDITIEGREAGRANVNQVSAGYLTVVGTPLVAGRDFDERDTASSPRVAIVTETFAARYLDGRPLGRTITMGQDDLLTVIGVVKDQKYHSVREAFSPLMFLADSQERNPGPTRRLAIRAVTPPGHLVAAVNATLSEIDPGISVRFATLRRMLDESLLRDRLMARLSAIFGIVALALAAVGLYGVVAYTVATRRSEIGVRMALGAGRGRILGMMMADTGAMLAVGLAAGAAAALAGAGLFGNLLYGIAPSDVTTLSLAGSVLAVAGLLAAALPARRAASIDPVEVLRES